MYTSTLKRQFGFAATAMIFAMVGGHFASVSAQRDPFQLPAYKRTVQPSTATPGTKKTTTTAPAVSFAPPMIEARIDYFKRIREAAVANGQTPPKVTSVLLVSELAVNGIFKTPRGYAAMVEALPIKLSYTIYPGEKFFDGQLVAVEENRLVFRKVTKSSPKTFVASVEYRPLQTYTMRSQVEGTAPKDAGDKPAQVAAVTPQPDQAAPAGGTPVAPAQIVSPLDEMNSQPAATDKAKPAKNQKRPAKVAKNGK